MSQIVKKLSCTKLPPFSDLFNVMGAQGADCNAACNEQGLTCNTHINTREDSKIMNNAGIPFCYRYSSSNTWFNNDQPGYVAGTSDPNRYRCIGFKKVPESVPCTGNYWSVQRLCACDNSGKLMPLGSALQSVHQRFSLTLYSILETLCSNLESDDYKSIVF